MWIIYKYCFPIIGYFWLIPLFLLSLHWSSLFFFRQWSLFPPFKLSCFLGDNIIVQYYIIFNILGRRILLSEALSNNNYFYFLVFELTFSISGLIIFFNYTLFLDWILYLGRHCDLLFWVFKPVVSV